MKSIIQVSQINLSIYSLLIRNPQNKGKQKPLVNYYIMDKSVQTLLIQDLFFYNFFSRLLADYLKITVKSMNYKGVVTEWE